MFRFSPSSLWRRLNSSWRFGSWSFLGSKLDSEFWLRCRWTSCSLVCAGHSAALWYLSWRRRRISADDATALISLIPLCRPRRPQLHDSDPLSSSMSSFNFSAHKRCCRFSRSVWTLHHKTRRSATAPSSACLFLLVSLNHDVDIFQHDKLNQAAPQRNFYLFPVLTYFSELLSS